MSDLSVKLTCNLSHFASYDTYFDIHIRPRANIVNMAPNISCDIHEMLCWWDIVGALVFTLLLCQI